MIDTDSRALEVAGQRGLATCLVDDIEPDRTFDVIFAIDVIEHVVSPAVFLKALGVHLAPSGLVVIETPSSSFWLRHLARREQPPRIGKRLRHFLYYYEHKHYFSRRGLAALARSQGFVVRSERLVGSPRSKIARSAFPGSSVVQRALRVVASIGMAAVGRRNKIWICLERRL